MFLSFFLLPCDELLVALFVLMPFCIFLQALAPVLRFYRARSPTIAVKFQ